MEKIIPSSPEASFVPLLHHYPTICVYQTEVRICNNAIYCLPLYAMHDKIKYCHHQRHCFLDHVFFNRRIWRTVCYGNGCGNGCFSIAACCSAVPPNAACGKRLRSSDFIKINNVFYTTPFTINFLARSAHPQACSSFSLKSLPYL